MAGLFFRMASKHNVTSAVAAPSHPAEQRKQLIEKHEEATIGKVEEEAPPPATNETNEPKYEE